MPILGPISRLDPMAVPRSLCLPINAPGTKPWIVLLSELCASVIHENCYHAIAGHMHVTLEHKMVYTKFWSHGCTMIAGVAYQHSGRKTLILIACTRGTKPMDHLAVRALVHRLIFQALSLHRIVQVVSLLLGSSF